MSRNFRRHRLKIGFIWQENSCLTFINSPQYKWTVTRHCISCVRRLLSAFLFYNPIISFVSSLFNLSDLRSALMSSQKPVSNSISLKRVVLTVTHSFQIRRKLVIVGDGESPIDLRWLILTFSTQVHVEKHPYCVLLLSVNSPRNMYAIAFHFVLVWYSNHPTY